MIVKILNKIRWIMLLFVTTNFQKKINLKISVYTQYHFIVCFWATIFLGGILSFILPIWLAIVIAVVGVFLLATISKEGVHDWLLKKGTPDWWDVLANLVGSNSGGIVLVLIAITLKAAEIIN